jgi:hypothetical protein
MRQEVREFVALGSLPDEQADEQQINQHEELLARITAPVTDEEAQALAEMFGPDDCYGLAWTLLHLIETAPNWPLSGVLGDDGNEWIQRLRNRAAAGRVSKAQ